MTQGRLFLYGIVLLLSFLGTYATVVPTTSLPPTTTSQCHPNESKVMNCYAFFCYRGRWQRFEFTASMDCCTKQLKHQGYTHPKCAMIFPDTFGSTPPVFVGVG